MKTVPSSIPNTTVPAEAAWEFFSRDRIETMDIACSSRAQPGAESRASFQIDDELLHIEIDARIELAERSVEIHDLGFVDVVRRKEEIDLVQEILRFCDVVLVHVRGLEEKATNATNFNPPRMISSSISRAARP